MTVTVRQGRTRQFGYKVAAGVVFACAVVAVVSRLFSEEEEIGTAVQSIEYPMIPVLCVEGPVEQAERSWTNLIAASLQGQTEVSYPGGRVDVLTRTNAIEVDFFKKWKEGIGQAIAYGDHFERTPSLALIVDGGDVPKDLQTVEDLAAKHGIRLLLVRATPDCDAT